MTSDCTPHVTIEPPTPGPLTFDRREDIRRAATGSATAFRQDHQVEAYQQPVCCMTLRDMSEGGMGAYCDVPLKTDENIIVYFLSHGFEGGEERHGHVVRCLPARHDNEAVADPDAGAYQVAIRFDPAVAA